MSNKNKVATINTLQAYDALRQQHQDGFKLVGINPAWYYTQERQQKLGGLELGVYESKPVNVEHELKIATLSEMMDEEALPNLVNDLKNGDLKARFMLIKAWLTLQNLHAMAKPFVGTNTKLFRATDVLDQGNDFVQITATFDYYGKSVIFANKSCLIRDTAIADTLVWPWINELLDRHKNRLGSIRIFMTRHENSYAHATISSGVTRMLSVPTTAGAQAGIEYALQANLRPDVTVSELLFG